LPDCLRSTLQRHERQGRACGYNSRTIDVAAMDIQMPVTLKGLMGGALVQLPSAKFRNSPSIRRSAPYENL